MRQPLVSDNRHQQPPAVTLKPRLIGDEMFVAEAKVGIRETALRSRARRATLAGLVDSDGHLWILGELFFLQPESTKDGWRQ